MQRFYRGFLGTVINNFPIAVLSKGSSLRVRVTANINAFYQAIICVVTNSKLVQ